MAKREYKDYYVGQVPLFVRTHYNEEDGYLCGHLHVRKGWHWSFDTILPHTFHGNPVHNGSVIQGPFDSEVAALADAAKHLSGNYHLPVVRPADREAETA